jgi:uncharacterized protein (TIGR04255 family)
MEKAMTELPAYRNPPLIEVVCGIQFQEMERFSSVHFGQFYDRIKSEYPQSEDHAPLSEIHETGQAQPVPSQPQIEVMDLPPLRRVFFVTEKGDFLYQLQVSRFLANWRKLQPSDNYPRFSEAFSRFVRGWRALLDFLASIGRGCPQANQYELTYINHILEGAEPFPAGIRHYIPVFSWTHEATNGFLPAPRTGAARLQYELPDKSGMLHVSINHGFRVSDKKSLVIMELTARGSASRDWREMDAWFELAHEWIVRGFTHLTSSQAHQEWGRII